MGYQYDTDTLADIRALEPWELANRGDAYADNVDAERFYASIRDAVVEATEYVDAEDWQREYVDDYSGSRSQIADNAPDVYTWALWSEFVGCRAWQWDADADGLEDSPSAGIEAQARLRLYLIADALVVALAREIAESIIETEDD